MTDKLPSLAPMPPPGLIARVEMDITVPEHMSLPDAAVYAVNQFSSLVHAPTGCVVTFAALDVEPGLVSVVAYISEQE